MYGHVYKMAEAIGEGAQNVDGSDVKLLQVQELIPDKLLDKAGAKKAREAFAHIPVAKTEDLSDADAISLLVHQHALVICVPRCAISSTKPEGYGQKVLSSAKWAVSSHQLPRNMVDKKQLLSAFTLPCFITE